MYQKVYDICFRMCLKILLLLPSPPNTPQFSGTWVSPANWTKGNGKQGFAATRQIHSKDPIGKIEEIFSIKWIDNPGSSYDVHPKEEKFLLIVPKTPFKKIREIRVLFNIENELKSLF